MNSTLKLPVGIENFEEIRKSGFYYVDKTKLIEQLLQNWGKVNLFTRPRRFGKTLNMSMLRAFFETGADPSLFEGLYISKNKEMCAEYMGKYPVIFLSFKGVDGLTFEEAQTRVTTIIRTEARRHYELKNSDRLVDEEIAQFAQLLAGKPDDLTDSIRLLSELLYRHFDQKVIIIIDEYDVPLDKAFQNGYYREMISLIRGLLGQALKTNTSLQFAVLTGCLRISKESIFTGLNNFAVNSVVDVEHDEQFGFTDTEVHQILDDYKLNQHFSEMKEWYDGYRFGNADIYCPWDVINHVKKLLIDPQADPQAFWINTSGNGLVKRFVDKADKTTRDEIEQLIAGNPIEKRIRLELTYDEIDNSIDNLWSVLFTTGYLTQVGKAVDGVYRLVIPNKEVREVFVFQIQEWFRQTIVEDAKPMQELCQAFLDGDAEKIQKHLTQILGRMISILDTKARDEQKENFYHGLLLGLLRSERDWLIRSNVESGDGFCDILIEPEDPDAGMVIELKYAATFRELDSACEKAMQQIRDRRYDEALRNDGRENILAYGIAFCKKRCKVVCEKL